MLWDTEQNDLNRLHYLQLQSQPQFEDKKKINMDKKQWY